ncbi:glucuronyl esterase domain-containing protein [Sorangium sp. So ce394]|uniref:glucuronyl esterase domain-containing protein n=1 Tax=Sorangium sp. So ce394 TaxID=3133310 RepID=UPI003F5C9459
MSVRSRASRKLTALAVPVLALFTFAGCSSEVGSGGTGEDASGTGGGTSGGSGGVTTGGGSATSGASATSGVAGTGGGAPTGGSGTGGSPTGGATGTGGNGGGGSFTCTLPTLPEPSALTEVNEKLPDPFTFFNGTKVTTKEQWECRRKEILAMAAKYLYGPVPGEPDEVTGTVSGGTVSITAKVGEKTESFSASISGSGDVIALELSGGIFPSSRKKLSFGSGFEGKIRNLFGLSELNTNIANGWMIDRVMDVLEQNPGSGHDPTKVMVSGCSGCGKGAYLAGVFSRAPVVVIVESGGGGVANLRQAEWFRHGEGGSVWQCSDAKPQSIDNLEDSGICGPWVTSAARWLRSDPSKVYNLPFDTHMILATIAPRHLVHFTNANGRNSWCHLGGTCEALSAWAAKPVWKALGVPERMGFQMYSANHCGASGSQTALAGEMFKRAFEGNTSANTDVMNILDNGVQQPVNEWKDMWVDWDMETVLQ